MEINLQKYSPKYICTCVKINLHLVPTKCKFTYTCNSIWSVIKKRKAGQKRGAAWSDGETRLLLSIWEEKSIEEQLDDPHVNNVGIYKNISDEIQIHLHVCKN
jgi:hypothetical protein